MKSRVTRSLEDTSPDGRRRFLPENTFFQANGTEAFRKFRAACMRPGERALVTPEEYSEMVEDMERGGIEIAEFSDVSGLERRLGSSRFDYILASEVGRLGTVYPLGAIHRTRRILSPQTKLIVDACQSAGRWKHDMKSCEADAVILSTQKGSDFGSGMGVLALANDFEHEGLSDLGGSMEHEAVVRTGFAMNPEGLNTLTPAQRAHENRQKAEKFLTLIAAINRQCGDRIEISNPTSLTSESLAHALELRVRGVKREAVSKLGAYYGVYLADSYKSAHSDESLRIAFHPYMNDDALKILAYVLLKSFESDQAA